MFNIRHQDYNAPSKINIIIGRRNQPIPRTLPKINHKEKLLFITQTRISPTKPPDAQIAGSRRQPGQDVRPHELEHRRIAEEFRHADEQRAQGGGQQLRTLRQEPPGLRGRPHFQRPQAGGQAAAKEAQA